MNIAYFDCFSGAAGDMILGALLDCGMPLAHLKRELGRLPLAGYDIEIFKRKKPIKGTDVRVAVKKDLNHSGYRSIDSMISKSRLSKPVKELSRAIFEKLGRAEAKVHGKALDHVHFHEVGATDSIVDIVGAAIGFDYFRFKEIYASPLPLSRGRIKCAHGFLPVPAPATIELMKGIPVEPASVRGELVTPTGAAILKTVVNHFGECPIQKVEHIGYGYGDKEFPDRINALRLIVGEGFPVIVIECDIDDMNPQIYDYALKKLFDAGALDVNLMPIQMKKTRPATRIHVVSPWDKKDALIDILLKETTTFGVRYFPVERRVLTRELKMKRTKFGKVRFKIGMDLNGNVLKKVLEYEDAVKIARRTGKPLAEVYSLALRR